jgi:hypothetical protein
MAYRPTTHGRKRGTRNQRTVRRRQKMADVTCVSVLKLDLLQRLRYASDFFFSLAEREREKGDRADLTFVVAMMQSGAIWAAKGAPYVRPKLAAMQFDLRPQQHLLDLAKLSDGELTAFERIVAKSQKSVRDEAESTPRTADEYWPTTKPVVGDESKHDPIQRESPLIRN